MDDDRRGVTDGVPRDIDVDFVPEGNATESDRLMVCEGVWVPLVVDVDTVGDRTDFVCTNVAELDNVTERRVRVGSPLIV